MSIIKKVRPNPIAQAEAAAIKASRQHEAGLAAIAAANDGVRSARVALLSHADDKADLANRLADDADHLRIVADRLSLGQSDDQVREVFAPVK